MPVVESTPLTPTDPGPVMVSWAHRPNEGVDAGAWEDTVFRFVTVLRSEGGITAELDLFHPSEDWTRWGPLQIQQCPRTLMVVNAAWRERFEGHNQPTEGAGAVAEADVLLGMFEHDQDDFHRRVMLVVLPGASQDDVPLRLRGIQRFTITEFTVEGLKALLRYLTGQPLYVPPPVGTVPVLPPATLPSAGAAAEALNEMSTTSSPEVVAPLETGLRDQSAGLRAALLTMANHSSVQAAASIQTGHLAEQLRVFAEVINRASSSSPAIQELQRTSAAAAQKTITSSLADSTSPEGAARAASRLADLLAQVGKAVEGENRCWLLLAGVLQDPDPAAMQGNDARSVRQRRQEQVSGWIACALPPVPLDPAPASARAAGRVVLSGPSNDAAAPGGASATWRLELGDHGQAVAAANIASDIITGVPFDPPMDGRRQYPDLHLPVRIDLLELWLLTQVELIFDHLAPMGAGQGIATVYLQAQLLLPDHLTHPEAYPRHGVRLVAASRDEDGHRGADSAVAGANDLRRGLASLDVGPLRTTVETLSDPAGLVGIARSMAVELIDYFGVENTSVLRADGTLDELAAGDQQAVWQHAGALGLTRDPVSPDQRRQHYDERLAQARAALRR